MLRCIIICPDADLSGRLETVLNEIGTVRATRKLSQYPSSLELIRVLRAHGPEVIFVSTESTAKVLEVAREVEKNTPGIHLVAVNRSCDPQILLQLMHAGIREVASLPFDRQTLTEALVRIKDALQERAPAIVATTEVFSFLPSKAGVGTSTIALNGSVAMSRLPDTSVLLSDFDLNSGMMRFMLKLDNPHSVRTAMEHSLDMDETMWPSMVTILGGLHVLHAGTLNPDFGIEAMQIPHLMEFLRRNYQVLCFDLSGNLEQYSIEIMRESKTIFLVCTAEIPSLHLAREKYQYLKHLDLGKRVSLVLNRHEKRSVISPTQVEQLIGLPIHMSFQNDYHGVQRALAEGRWLEPNSELGEQFTGFAQSILQNKPISDVRDDAKKRFLDFFSVAKNPVTSGTI
jgi:pilus assembly protein CpaE